MQDSGVMEVDLLAETMYSAPDPVERQRARVSLDRLTHDEANRTFLYTILRESSNQYTLIFMAQSLVLWFKSTRRWMSESEKRELVVLHCGGCLRRVFDRGAPKHVVTSLLLCYAKLTKLSFETEPLLESAVDYPLELLLQEPVGSSARMLGFLLLDTMVSEFSKYDSGKSQMFLSFVAHRHCSLNFKEHALLRIFDTAMKDLNRVTATSPDVGEVVRLVESCLAFDFRAIMVDETEEVPFAQFPPTWKSTLLNEANLRTLWGQHAALPHPHCLSLLTGISNVCGINRTFFDTIEERSQYIQNTLSMMVEVTMLQDGRLKNPPYITVFAEACRRIVVSFGYREMRPLAAFAPWVSALQRLSVDVLSIPFGQEGCFAMSTAVFSFWTTLTTSKRRFCSDENPRDLEDIVAPLLQAFLQARIRSSEGCADMTAESGEEDSALEAVLAQADGYSTITLLDPVPCLNALANYLNQCVGMSILASPNSTGWLFYLAGSLVRLVLSNVEEDSVEACSHVFAYVVGCANHRLRREGDQKMFGSFVERGMLHLLSNVQMVLTGSRVHTSLSAIITNVFESRSRLFQFVLDNTGHNLLRLSTDTEAVEIIRTSLDVITDACRDAPPALLSELSFDLPPIADLPLSQSESTYKLRTNLMRALWFLRKTGPYSRDHMISYLQNVEISMQQTLNEGGMTPSFVAGWLRDLRGACQALNEDEDPFCDFIDWFCERVNTFHMVILSQAAESPVVINSMMRFLCELVTPGKYGRLHVSSSAHSAMGLVLFKHLCVLLSAVEERFTSADRIRSIDGSSGAYDSVMKPWMLSMEVIRKCIQGEFIPFGAMWYYHDDSLDNTVVGLLQKITLISLNVFKEHIKFTVATFDLLRTLTETNVYLPLSKLSSDELRALIGAVIVICEDVETPTGAVLHGIGFLSFIAGLVREVKAIVLSPGMRPDGFSGALPPLSPPPPSLQQQQQQHQGFFCGSLRSRPGCSPSRGHPTRLPRFSRQVRESLAQLLSPHMDIWQRLIAVAMGIIVFQDRAVSVSSSVVYPIFETHPPFWYAFVEEFLASFPERKRTVIREALSKLANAAESQEKFFSEVFAFRQTLRRINV